MHRSTPNKTTPPLKKNNAKKLTKGKKLSKLQKVPKRSFSIDAAANGATLTQAQPLAIKKDGKIDINAVEDLFRAHRLSGLSEKYHHLTQAFDLVRAEGGITPQVEEDLQRVFQVTSLKTADAAELRKAKTRALINHYQRRPGDTGSSEVQCVLLTERLNTLEFHLTRHPQDHQLQRELQLVKDRRRKMLKYLKRERFRTYQVICRDLNIDEHVLEIVGKLPRTIPYYDPTRKKYRKPLTDEERREEAQRELLAQQEAVSQQHEDKKKALRDAVYERRRQANMMDI